MKPISERVGPYLPLVFQKALKKPTFLIGTGRSGSSLLSSILHLHPEICVFPGEANHLWHPNLYPYHDSQINTPPIWIDPEEFTKSSLQSYPTKWKATIKAIFGAEQFLNRGSVFLNKSVMVNFMVGEILEIFPSARFIHLYRNGLPVVFSLQKKELDKYQKHSRYLPYSPYFSSPQALRLQHAKYWNLTITHLEKLKESLFNPSNLLEIKYESLVLDPDKVCQELFTFLGLKPYIPNQMQEFFNQIEDKNFKYKDLILEEEKENLTTAMEEGLRLKGYLPAHKEKESNSKI